MNARDRGIPTWRLVLHALEILAVGAALLVSACTDHAAWAVLFATTLIVIMIEDKTDELRDTSVAAHERVRLAARYRGMAVHRFDEHGFGDSRGAALWDVAVDLLEREDGQ